MWGKSEVLLGTSWGHFGKPMGTLWELQWNTLRTEEKSLSPNSLGQGYEIICGAIKKIRGNTLQTC
jgi:hypothetical protein